MGTWWGFLKARWHVGVTHKTCFCYRFKCPHSFDGLSQVRMDIEFNPLSLTPYQHVSTYTLSSRTKVFQPCSHQLALYNTYIYIYIYSDLGICHLNNKGSPKTMVCLQWVMIGYWLPSLKEMPNCLFHWITTWPSLTRWANYLSPCPRQAHLLSGSELMILEASWPMRCCGMFLEVFPGNQSIQ